ncbi:Pre-mRNA-processing factor [Entamoeba marina]
MNPKLDFLNQPAPKDYVAGSLRADTGFVTRNDIGPARLMTVSTTQSQYNEEDDFQTTYDHEDEEADRLYDCVHERMDSRRKKRREARAKEEQEKFDKDHPKLLQQFADLREDMEAVSPQEWLAIPEVTGRRVRRFENEFLSGRHMPVPDSVLASSYMQGKTSGTVQDGAKTDLLQLGQTRKKTLQLSLDGKKTSAKSVNVSGYLTELGEARELSTNDVNQIKQYRFLFKSMRTTKPELSVGWIQSALVEESLGRLSAARKIIMEATVKCSCEEVWLQAIRLHPNDSKADICASAIAQLPHKPTLWLEALKIENNVLEKTSAIDLEDGDLKRDTLKRAVEALPSSVELWLQYAESESYGNAKKILNQKPRIWLAAARLEEFNALQQSTSNKENTKSKAVQIVKKAVKYFVKENIPIDQPTWLNDIALHLPTYIQTATAVIEDILSQDVSDMSSFLKRLHETSESFSDNRLMQKLLYQHASHLYPHSSEVWIELIRLSEDDDDQGESVVRSSIETTTNDDVLAAVISWASNKSATIARSILAIALEKENGDRALLTAVNVELREGNQTQAQILLEKGIEKQPTCKLIRKAIKIASLLHNTKQEMDLIERGIQLDPYDIKMWRWKIDCAAKEGDADVVRKIYTEALERIPNAVDIWIDAAHWEEGLKTPFSQSKARALFEKAKIKNPKSAQLMLEFIHFEKGCGNKKIADTLMATGVRECNDAGILWAEIVNTVPFNKRKTECLNALKNCGNDAYVVFAAAKYFYGERKREKALNWLNKAVTINPKLGDAWIWLYKIELEYESTLAQNDLKTRLDLLVKRCGVVPKKKGDIWYAYLTYPIHDILQRGVVQLN